MTDAISSIYQRLLNKLIGSKIESRIIKVKPNNENSDEDLLSFFVKDPDNYIFGMIMRLSSKKNIKAVPLGFANLENLRFGDLHEVKDEHHEMYCTSHYYFLLKGNFLVTDLPKTMSICRFQDYINKLLDQDEKYVYAPMLDTDEIALNDVSKIVVKDSFNDDVNVGDTGKTINSKIKKLRNFIFKKLVPMMPSLSSLDKKNIFSAELTIKTSKPRNMSADDYKNSLSAFLQPISDARNVKVYTSKGIIAGDQLNLTETIEIDDNDSLTFENSLMNEMKKQYQIHCASHED